ncbi:MAG: hypothetical protein ACRC7R_07300 [Sarcina sp.]
MLDCDNYYIGKLEKFNNNLSKMRILVETSLSQLAGELNINRVLAKSKWVLMTRITSKVLTNNSIYLLNSLIGKTESIAQIKHLIFG